MKCACGQPLHYTNPVVQAMVEDQIRTLGETIDIIYEDKCYKMQRHYVALHGIKAVELPMLAEQFGFEVEDATSR